MEPGGHAVLSTPRLVRWRLLPHHISECLQRTPRLPVPDHQRQVDHSGLIRSNVADGVERPRNASLVLRQHQGLLRFAFVAHLVNGWTPPWQGVGISRASVVAGGIEQSVGGPVPTGITCCCTARSVPDDAVPVAPDPRPAELRRIATPSHWEKCPVRRSCSSVPPSARETPASFRLPVSPESCYNRQDPSFRSGVSCDQDCVHLLRYRQGRGT